MSQAPDTSNTPPKPPVIKVDNSPPRPPLKIANKTADRSADNPLDGLKAFVSGIAKRHSEVEALFTEKPEISPVKHSEFKKFINDTLAEVAMRYVVFGSFKNPSDTPDSSGDPIADKMKEQGFNVSAEQLTGLDPALRSNPAALMALSEGADLNGDSEEISERLT